MKITQIRNATIVIETEHGSILVDPMLANKSTLPKLRFNQTKQRNPTVELPKEFKKLEDDIKYALITHCQKGHFDHLDKAGVRWLLDNKTKPFCTIHDFQYLRKKGINASVLKNKISPFFDGTIEQIPAKHARSWLTPFMEHGTGYFIKMMNEPSLYLMGDTILTDIIREFIYKNQPDFIVAPTGKAQFDIGSSILMNESEILELAALSQGRIIANHMDALDHCRISRSNLTTLISQQTHSHKFLIPRDGDTFNICL